MTAATTKISTTAIIVGVLGSRKPFISAQLHLRPEESGKCAQISGKEITANWTLQTEGRKDEQWR